MDKHIKMLLIKLSQKYEKASLVTFTYFNEEFGYVSSSYKLTLVTGYRKLKNGKSIPIKSSIEAKNKRQLLMEMMAWVKEKN